MPQNHLDWIIHLSTDYFGSGSIIFYDESLIFSTEMLKRDFYSLTGYRVVEGRLAFNDHQVKYCQVKICLSFSQGKSYLKSKQHFTSKESRCCWGGQLRFTLWNIYWKLSLNQDRLDMLTKCAAFSGCRMWCSICCSQKRKIRNWQDSLNPSWQIQKRLSLVYSIRYILDRMQKWRSLFTLYDSRAQDHDLPSFIYSINEEINIC